VISVSCMQQLRSINSDDWEVAGLLTEDSALATLSSIWCDKRSLLFPFKGKNEENNFWTLISSVTKVLSSACVTIFVRKKKENKKETILNHGQIRGRICVSSSKGLNALLLDKRIKKTATLGGSSSRLTKNNSTSKFKLDLTYSAIPLACIKYIISSITITLRFSKIADSCQIYT